MLQPALLQQLQMVQHEGTGKVDQNLGLGHDLGGSFGESSLLTNEPQYPTMGYFGQQTLYD